MRKVLFALTLLIAAFAVPASAQSDWKATVAERLPLMGHRNWILIADSAYPLQTSPGIETIETNTDQIEVVRYVLAQINASIHVRPEIFMDAELPYVPEQDAPGANAYRKQIGEVLSGYTVTSRLHEKLIAEMGQASQSFHILVLKTNLTVPYTSVFIRLNCKYWPNDAEKRMRAQMPTTK